MKKLLLLISALTFSLGFTQVKFGKVSAEDLQKSESSFEKDAAAEIVSKSAWYQVSYSAPAEKFEVTKEIEVRIKIYDKDKAPDRLLNIQIPSYKIDGTQEKITGVKASTYNLQNGSVSETKVKSSDIFKEKIHDYLEVEKFAFPNVNNGSILEYRYSINSPRFYDTDVWFFQAEVPVLHNRFYFEYPEFFIFQQDRRGDIAQKIQTKTLQTAYDFKNKAEILEMTNIPSLMDEPFVQNTDNLRTSIRYELVEYFYPGRGYQNFSTTWERIAKDLYNSSSYGSELKGNGFLDDSAAQFQQISDPVERMSSVFNHVRSNYSWNGYTGLYPKKGVRKTFNEKTGNGSDINFILISMLKKANIEAYPVILSTVENGMLNFFPSIHKLNHTLTAAVINKQLFLMDPIEKLSGINMLPTRDLNFVGYMIKENGEYSTVKLVNGVQSEVKNTLIYELKDDKHTGSFAQVKNNYFAMSDMRKKMQDESNFQKNYLSKYDFDATDFKFQTSETSGAVRYSINFEDEKNLEVVGNKMILKLLLFLSTDNNEFSFRNAERKYPLEFGTPFTFHSTAVFKIPEGYQVESLPKDYNVQLEQKTGVYDLKFAEDNGKITVTSLLHIPRSILPQNYYSQVKNMFEQIIQKENEQIILVKK